MAHEPFKPSPNLSPAINQAIIDSELQGGATLDKLAVGRCLKIQTRNSLYTLAHVGPDQWTLQGHPYYCPEPVRVIPQGSTWGGSMIKVGFVGIGMLLQVVLMKRDMFLTTSLVQSVTEEAIPE